MKLALYSKILESTKLYFFVEPNKTTKKKRKISNFFMDIVLECVLLRRQTPINIKK